MSTPASRDHAQCNCAPPFYLDSPHAATCPLWAWWDCDYCNKENPPAREICQWCGSVDLARGEVTR